MTKKDYIKIADCIKNVINHAELNDEQVSLLITNFSSMLKADNSRFDAQRFIDYIAYFK